MVKTNNWLDGLSLVLTIGIVMGSVIWMASLGMFNMSWTLSENLTWYFIRSTGITAYILMTLSVLWGLALSSKVVKHWSPGMLSMMLHSGLSWMAVVMTIAHASLLMFDTYFTYQIPDLLIPFIGPYRPFAVGLGTIAFWGTLIVTLSFSFRKRLGNRLWKRIHYLSYGAFILVTAHGLMAGTDADHIGFQALFWGAVLISVLLLGYRLHGTAKSPQSTTRTAKGAA